MNTFFTIAADFIDRMANPAHGVLVNQDYSLQFAELLSAEEDSIDPTLRREAKRLADADVLSANGWLWFLTWARSESIALREDLLLNITQKWSSVFIQTLAIEIALENAEWSNRRNVQSLSEFGNPFLRKLLMNAVRIQEPEGRDHPDHPDHPRFHRRDYLRTSRAQSVLTSLLEIDSSITDAAAASLLQHEWPGQKQLLEFYESLVSGFDPDTREEWGDRFSF